MLKVKYKKGLSLVEALVAISIFTLGVGGFALLFYYSWKANSFILEEGMAASQADKAVNSIAKNLRKICQSEVGGYMIEKAGKTELVVFLNDDDDEQIERVRYFLEDGTLKKGVAQASGNPLAYPSGYSSDEVSEIVHYVSNDPENDPIFIYYNINNEQLGYPPVRNDIRLIEVNLWINIKPLSAPENVRISTSVLLRNLESNG